jgi:hypothetical protein
MDVSGLDVIQMWALLLAVLNPLSSVTRVTYFVRQMVGKCVVRERLAKICISNLSSGGFWC